MKAIRYLIKPFLKFERVKVLIQILYITTNRIIRYKHIKKKRKTISNDKIKIFNYENHDTFFGYYDISPVNESNTQIVFHASPFRTFFKPKRKKRVKIIVQNLNDGVQRVIAETNAYNWQQGARLQWISDTEILFNDFCPDKKIYVSHCYNTITGKLIKSFDYPVQTAYADKKFYSLNYDRLRELRPDYGYFNTSRMSTSALLNLKDDGIWEIDFQSNKSELIISLEDVVNIKKDKNLVNGFHWINHVMISPSGRKLIFLHRFKSKRFKQDRLFSFDLATKNLNLIVNYSIVSHFNWINEDSIICFQGPNINNLSFKKIDLSSKEIVVGSFFKKYNKTDGHPTIGDDIFITDTYPDNFGFQKLIYVNNNKLKVIYESYHPLYFFKENRCDLHPRLHHRKIYFDQIINSQRKLSVINIPEII